MKEHFTKVIPFYGGENPRLFEIEEEHAFILIQVKLYKLLALAIASISNRKLPSSFVRMSRDQKHRSF